MLGHLLEGGAAASCGHLSGALRELGIKISDGIMENICSEAADILKPHYESLKEEYRKIEATKNDDTGKRIEGENCWERVFAKPDTAVFHLDKRRSHNVMERLYGKHPKPVLGSNCTPLKIRWTP